MKPPPPSEETEQKIVVNWLRAKGVLFSATANGARMSWKQAKKLKSTGCSKGLVDLLIFDRPTHEVLVGSIIDSRPAGIAIEMKRRNSVPSAVSPEQREWLDALEQRGWLVKVAKGAIDAIQFLEGVGL